MQQEIKVTLRLTGKPTIFSPKDIEIINKDIFNIEYDSNNYLLVFGQSVDAKLSIEELREDISSCVLRYNTSTLDFELVNILEERDIYI